MSAIHIAHNDSDSVVLICTKEIHLKMPPKHKKSHKNGKSEINPGPGVQNYHGPIIPKAMKEENELYSVPLRFTGTLASTAGGVIDAYYSSDPSSYALAEWTSLASLYGEYRVLGMVVEFAPNNRYSKAATVCTPLLVLSDRESPSSTLGSYQSAMSHESCRILTLEDPWKHSVKMSNAEESQFRSTGSPTPLFSVKFYSDGLSVSTTYGRMFVVLLVQFRARR